MRISRIFVFVSLFIFSFQLSSAQIQPIRTVNLRVAADEEFRKGQNWRLEIKRHVTNASQVFEQRFGIKFEIKTIDFWASDNSQNSMLDLLNDLRKKIPQEDCDVVLGFTAQRFEKSVLGGIASYMKCYALVRRLKSPFLMRRMIAHELCHLFGAIDLNEKGSIMDKQHPAFEFDEFTSQTYS